MCPRSRGPAYNDTRRRAARREPHHHATPTPRRETPERRQEEGRAGRGRPWGTRTPAPVWWPTTCTNRTAVKAGGARMQAKANGHASKHTPDSTPHIPHTTCTPEPKQANPIGARARSPQVSVLAQAMRSKTQSNHVQHHCLAAAAAAKSSEPGRQVSVSAQRKLGARRPLSTLAARNGATRCHSRLHSHCSAHDSTPCLQQHACCSPPSTHASRATAALPQGSGVRTASWATRRIEKQLQGESLVMPRAWKRY